MPLAMSALIVKVESPRNRDSPLTLLDWPGSQCLASPFTVAVLIARSASAPPSASTACLTRSAGAVPWAAAGCVWPTATHRAADSRSAYRMQSSLSDFRELGLVAGLVEPPSRADPRAVTGRLLRFYGGVRTRDAFAQSGPLSRAMPQRFQGDVASDKKAVSLV